MKKLILSIILFLFTFYTEAQTLQFDWAITQGTSSDADYVDDVSPSADGNIVVCGAFSGTLDFDYGAGVDSHTSLGFQDAGTSARWHSRRNRKGYPFFLPK